MKDNVKRKTIKRNLRHWTLNCFRFYYQRMTSAIFKNRNKKIWVFSAWEGNKYSDNAKYLYEYMTKNSKDIDCIWMTKSETVYKKLIKEGKKVCLIGTKESKQVQLRAGVAIYTHGLDDFGDFPYIFGAFTVSLWHGVGVKKNYSTRTRHDNVLLDSLANVKARIFSYIYRDLTITSSKYLAYVSKKESLTKNKIIVAGQPRNDIFKFPIEKVGRIFSYGMTQKNNIDIDRYTFLTYMPTYRGTVESQKFLKKIITQVAENNELNEFLKENSSILLIKVHYLTDISGINTNQNVIFLDDNDIYDTQRLLYISKLLITDYSSCAIDFALKNNDIIFFTPDFETYSVENGLYEEYVNLIAPYRVSTIEKLMERIKLSKKNEYKGTEVTDAINKMYNEKNSEIGTFCKQITSIIKESI